MAGAVVNGATLHYEVAPGDGPLCLVLHGWPGTDHTYLRPGLEAALASRLSLVFYDHRGHGRSGLVDTATLTVEQLADDAEALAATLGTGPVVVFGHFQGAFVAQELALRHPGRVAGLVLVAATPGELGRDESLADLGPPTTMEAESLRRVPPGSDDELAATLGALEASFFFRPPPPDRPPVFARTAFSAEAAVALLASLNWWSAVDRLGQLDIPALLLVGRHDQLCPPAEPERIHRRLARSELVVLEESGHLPWAEEPEAFRAAVTGWLDGLALPPA